MWPSAQTSRSHRRRQAAPPAELSKERLQTEVASIDSGLKLLDVYTAALTELKERGQDAAGDIKLALDVRHAPRDWSNVEILSVMSEIIDEHPRPRLEFVLGVLGVSKVPDSLDERLRSKGAKAYAVGVRTRSLRKKKEARERQERLERERREKKEREERERREEQERKERKEKEEKERLERERIEKQRAEEEKRKAAAAAAERKEAEARKARGKSRRARRGRASTRVAAADRAKKIAIENEASDVKKTAVASAGELQGGDAINPEAHEAKLDSENNKTLKTNMRTEEKETPSDMRFAGPSQSAKVENQTAKAPSGTSRRARGMQGTKPSAAQRSKQKARKDGPISPNEDTTNAITDGSAKQEGSLVTTSGAVAAGQQTTVVTEADDNKIKGSISLNEADSKTASREATRTQDANDPRSATADAKEVATTPIDVLNAKAPPSKNATPRIIEESKIASALKESAAAVNGEVRDVHGSASVAKDIAADVGTGVLNFSGLSEKKEAIVNEVLEEENLTKTQPEKVQAAKGGLKLDGDVTGQEEKRKEPIELEDKAQTVKTDGANAGEKSKATESPPKVEDGGEISKGGVAEKIEDVKEKTTVKPSNPETTSDTKPEKARKQGDKGAEIKSAQNEDKEGGEVETEDFMADVFGSDEEGDKEDTEEASDKRGRVYRTRGRQSDVSDSSDDGAVPKRESDEEAEKAQTKRARSTGGRRVSRRMSNMRDEIVVASSGRRMRRESRNLMKRTWELPEPDQYLLECVEVWERVHANKISIPFREPVTAKDAPGYFDIVKQPMDLKTVKDMLQDGRISSPVAFYENMRLIVRNACLFNDRDSDLYELAIELRDLIRKDTKPIVRSWREARGLDSEDSESESEIESVRKKGRGRPKKKAKAVKSKKKRKRGKEEEAGKGKKRRVLRRSSRTGGDDAE